MSKVYADVFLFFVGSRKRYRDYYSYFFGTK